MIILSIFFLISVSAALNVSPKMGFMGGFIFFSAVFQGDLHSNNVIICKLATNTPVEEEVH